MNNVGLTFSVGDTKLRVPIQMFVAVRLQPKGGLFIPRMNLM
jgi:hypothetical protein